MLPLLLVFLALPAAASSPTDLRTTIEAPESTNGYETVSLKVTVKNIGPVVAEDAVVSYGVGYLEPACANERPLPPLAPGETWSDTCQVQLRGALYRFYAYGCAWQPNRTDPFPEDNCGTKNITVFTPSPDVNAFVSAPLYLDRGLPFPVQLHYLNDANTPAKDVQLVANFTNVTGFRNLPPNCTASGTRVVCNVGDVPGFDPERAYQAFIIDLEAIAADASNVTIDATIDATAANGDMDPEYNHQEMHSHTFRAFEVTNTNDSGTGSLRAALAAAQANGCPAKTTPCKISFRIPANGAAVQTIAPLTPYGRIEVGNLIVDGETQARYASDSNPNGPEIELTGRNLQRPEDGGNGIDLLTKCNRSVRGLVINGFPGAGIALTGEAPPSSDCFFVSYDQGILRNYLGTDATGTKAVPNGRGIVVDGPLYGLAITNNVISGNTRSGIFIANGPNTAISLNKIGLDVNRKPLGNGASGIYLGAGAGGSDVSDNYIGFNTHAGISVDAMSRLNAFNANSFQANGSLAIDYNLDGVSDSVVSPAKVPVQMPEILSARYDVSTDTTVITGKTTNQIVNVYANDAPDATGYGEGQYYLGRANVQTSGNWRFEQKGDLTGKWIAATATYSIYNGWLRDGGQKSDGNWQGFETTTSEFSRAVEVTR